MKKSDKKSSGFLLGEGRALCGRKLRSSTPCWLSSRSSSLLPLFLGGHVLVEDDARKSTPTRSAFPSKQFYFQNYVNAWNRANMGSYFGHSILLTAGSLALLIVLAVPCSYTLSRFKFRGRKRYQARLYVGAVYQYQLYRSAALFNDLRRGQGDRSGHGTHQ